MNKRPLLLSLFVFISIQLFSQAYEDKLTYDKKKQMAIAINYRYSQEAVQNAVIEKFRAMGYKPKEEKGLFNADKGVLVFKNAYVMDISAERMDYIVKVDRKSRRDADEAELYMIIMKDDVNALEKMDVSGIGKSKLFLNNLVPDIEAADLELKIKAQEALLLKTEKKIQSLETEQADLEKKLKGNAQDQIDSKKNLEDQRKELEVLKGKRAVSR
jgi:hypothetical protein